MTMMEPVQCQVRSVPQVQPVKGAVPVQLLVVVVGGDVAVGVEAAGAVVGGEEGGGGWRGSNVTSTEGGLAPTTAETRIRRFVCVEDAERAEGE